MTHAEVWITLLVGIITLLGMLWRSAISIYRMIDALKDNTQAVNDLASNVRRVDERVTRLEGYVVQPFLRRP